jgi:putative SOS response-associated peptidase YedK
VLRPPGVAYPYPCHIHGIDIFAAIRDPTTKEPLEMFAVITTDANQLEPMHDRMPVIL